MEKKNKKVEIMDFSSQPLQVEGEYSSANETPNAVPTRAQNLALQGIDSSDPITPSKSVAAPEIVGSPEGDPGNRNWDWGELMIGAAPALAGILTGNTADGYNLGGKGLVDRQKQLIDINSKKAAALRKQSLAADKPMRGKFQAKVYEKDGISYLGKMDTTTGQVYDNANNPINDPKLIAGYKQSLRSDPTTDELIKFTGGGNIENIRGVDPGKFTIKQEKEMDGLKAKLFADPKYKTARKTISTSRRAISLLHLGNPVADEGIATLFPRMFGEVGNLSWQEQARFQGSQSLQRKWSRLKERMATGTLTNDDRSDLMEVAQVMYEYDKSNLHRSANSHITSFKRQQGYDPSAMIEPFLNEGTPSPGKTVSRARKASPTAGLPPEKGVKVKGGYEIYKLQPQGHYEYDHFTETLKGKRKKK